MIRPGVVVLTGKGHNLFDPRSFLPRYRLERACQSKILRCVVNEIISLRVVPGESNPRRASETTGGKAIQFRVALLCPSVLSFGCPARRLRL